MTNAIRAEVAIKDQILRKKKTDLRFWKLLHKSPNKKKKEENGKRFAMLMNLFLVFVIFFNAKESIQYC